MRLGAIAMLGVSWGWGSAVGQVALGTMELKGGTTIVTVSTSALVPTSARWDMSGFLRNRLGNGQTIEGLTVEVRRKGAIGVPPRTEEIQVGSATDLGPSRNPASDGDHSHFSSADLDEGIRGDATTSVRIGRIGPGTAPDVEVCVTPCLGDKPKGSGALANTLVGFDVSPAETVGRHAVESMWRDRLAFSVSNRSDASDIVELTGTVTTPSSSVRTIDGVFLQDPAAGFEPVPGASVSIEGGRFTIEGFDALQPGHSYEVVVVFSSAFEGEPVEVRMEAGD